MTYKNWKKVLADKELFEVCESIQNDIIGDFFNEDDYSVGIFPVGEINKHVVNELNEYEGLHILDWEKDYVMIEVNEKFTVDIQLTKIGKDYDDSDIYDWQISYAERLKNI